MPGRLRDLLFRVKIGDDTDDGATQIEQKLESRFSGPNGAFAKVAAAAATVGAALLSGIADAVERGQELIQGLQLATGTGSERQLELQEQLLGQGFESNLAAQAVAATTGRFPELRGVAQEQISIELARAARAGASPSDIGRIAQRFGIADDPYAVAEFINYTFAGAAAQDADFGQVIGDVRTNAAILEQLRLSPVEAGQFVLDAERQGVDFGSLGFGLDRLQREATEAGADPRAFAEAAFDVLGNASEFESRRLGLELFGSRGATEILPLVRSGAIGFGSSLDVGHLAGELDTRAIQPTVAEVGAGIRDAAAARIARGEGTTRDYAIVTGQGSRDFAEGLPVVGDVIAGGLSVLEQDVLGGAPARAPAGQVGDRFGAGASESTFSERSGADRTRYVNRPGQLLPNFEEPPAGGTLIVNVNAGMVTNEQDVAQLIRGLLTDPNATAPRTGAARYE